jgi:hypothetical protein
VAILLALIIVNQGSPLVATVIPVGSLPLTAFDWVVITPSGVIRAMFPAVERVNYIEPSGAGAMSSGPPSTGNNCTAFVSCNHSGLHPKAALCTGPNAPRFAGRIGGGDARSRGPASRG